MLHNIDFLVKFMKICHHTFIRLITASLLIFPLVLSADNYTIAPLGSPRILLSDNTTLSRLQTLMQANTTSATRFKEIVDNQIAGVDEYWYFQYWHAALLGKVLNQAHYCQYAVKKTDEFIKSEEVIINKNQRPTIAYDSYLEIGPIIANTSIVYDWCRSTMDNTQRQRWRKYANQAVWNIWHPAQAKWGNKSHPWSGWAIDNPSNNYYYSFLEATMLLGLATYGENAQALTWLNQFRITKLENQLFPTFNQTLQGGGSREGTGYGVSMQELWRLYDWWEHSTGERIADNTLHTKASLAAMLFQITPSLVRLNPTGDHARDSTAMLFDYHRNYLQILMQLYPDELASGIAKTVLANSSVKEMQSPFMFVWDYLYDSSNISSQSPTLLNTVYHSKGTGQLAIRSDWNLNPKNATHINFICGAYTENHAHRDQGSFTLFQRNWLAYDANIDSHSGIQQEEPFHNLVRFEKNGTLLNQGMSFVNEAAPCMLRGLAQKNYYTYAMADIKPVYKLHPEIIRNEREMIFISPSILVLLDRINTNTNTKKIWTLNLPQKPSISGNKTTLIRKTNTIQHQLDVIRLSPIKPIIKINDWKLINADLSNGYRLDVTDNSTSPTYFLHVFDINKSVKIANLINNSLQIGTYIELNNNKKINIKFNKNTRGGSIIIKNSLSNLIVNEDLPTTIQTLNLYKK